MTSRFRLSFRKDELLGLSSDRVNFLKRCIVIDRQLVSVNNERPVFEPPKTGALNRNIPLLVVLGDAVLERLTRFEVGPGGSKQGGSNSRSGGSLRLSRKRVTDSNQAVPDPREAAVVLRWHGSRLHHFHTPESGIWAWGSV